MQRDKNQRGNLLMWLMKNVLYFEPVGVAIVIVAAVLYLNFLPGGTTILMLSVLALMLMYIFFGTAILNQDYFGRAQYLLGIFGCMPIALVLFSCLSYPLARSNYNSQLVIALAGMVVIGAFLFIYRSQISDTFQQRVLLRYLVYSILACILLKQPVTFLIEIKYKDRPAFITAYKQAVQQPKNLELWDNLEVWQDSIDNEIRKNKKP